MIFYSMLIPRLNVAVVLLFLNVECYNFNGDVKLQPPRATKEKEKYHPLLYTGHIGDDCYRAYLLYFLGQRLRFGIGNFSNVIEVYKCPDCYPVDAQII